MMVSPLAAKPSLSAASQAWGLISFNGVDRRHLNGVDAPCQRQPPCRHACGMLKIEAAGRSREARSLFDLEVV
jgi:hypothetical protein